MDNTIRDQYRVLESFRNGKIMRSGKKMHLSSYIRNLDGIGFLKAIMDQDVPGCAKIADIAYAKASIFIRNKHDDTINTHAPYDLEDVHQYWDHAEAVLRGGDQLILDICDPTCTRPISGESRYARPSLRDTIPCQPWWLPSRRSNVSNVEYCHMMLNCSTNDHHVEWQPYIYWWAPDATGERQRSDGLIELQ